MIYCLELHYDKLHEYSKCAVRGTTQCWVSLIAVQLLLVWKIAAIIKRLSGGCAKTVITLKRDSGAGKFQTELDKKCGDNHFYQKKVRETQKLM